MSAIESIVREINKDLVPRFEENQAKDWLIEQIVRMENIEQSTLIT